MNVKLTLNSLLDGSDRPITSSRAIFALLTLGILEWFASRPTSAANDLLKFFRAENCLFVRDRLRNRIADQIMSRGVQLPDLFDALPTAEVQREFQHELAAMRSLCLKLLEEKKLVA